MALTYVDSGILIAAARLTDPPSAAANALLGDPSRTFASSIFAQLEVLPKATFYNRTAEATFYTLYFQAVQRWVNADLALMQLALRRGAEFGLNGMDALHIAAAEVAGVDEFVTTERTTSPLLRVTSMRIVSLHP